ncbi:MAG: BON domain-containing protein [Acidobacteriota bacterium]
MSKIPAFPRSIQFALAGLLLLTSAACTGNQTLGEEIDDAVITSKIEAKMAADPEVSAFKVDVDTDNGVVRLSGVVEDRRAKEEAEDLAESTQGVQRVINDITVGKLSAGERLGDVGITARVKARLAADPEVNPFDIDVDTDAGVVTLSGVVKNRKVRREAVDLAEGVEGVVRVRNRLKLESQ